MLLGGREPGEQREHLGVGQPQRVQGVGGVADLALAGEEHEDVGGLGARGRLGPQLLDGLDDAGHLVALGDDVAAVGVQLDERPVADLDREGAAGDLDDRHLAHDVPALVGGEVRGEAHRVDRRRGDDHLEVGAARQQLLEVAEDEVDVERPLVRLVDDDRVVAAQVAVALHLGEQDAVGHHLQPGRVAAVVGEPHLVADERRRARPASPRRSARRPTGRRSAGAGCGRSGPLAPRPSSRHIFGSWVVLPEPVSPATTTTWWSRSAARMSSRRSTTGRCSGYLSRAGSTASTGWAGMAPRIGRRRPAPRPVIRCHRTLPPPSGRPVPDFAAPVAATSSVAPAAYIRCACRPVGRREPPVVEEGPVDPLPRRRVAPTAACRARTRSRFTTRGHAQAAPRPGPARADGRGAGPPSSALGVPRAGGTRNDARRASRRARACLHDPEGQALPGRQPRPSTTTPAAVRSAPAVAPSRSTPPSAPVAREPGADGELPGIPLAVGHEQGGVGGHRRPVGDGDDRLQLGDHGRERPQGRDVVAGAAHPGQHPVGQRVGDAVDASGRAARPRTGRRPPGTARPPRRGGRAPPAAPRPARAAGGARPAARAEPSSTPAPTSATARSSSTAYACSASSTSSTAAGYDRLGLLHRRRRARAAARRPHRAASATASSTGPTSRRRAPNASPAGPSQVAPSRSRASTPASADSRRAVDASRSASSRTAPGWPGSGGRPLTTSPRTASATPRPRCRGRATRRSTAASPSPVSDSPSARRTRRHPPSSSSTAGPAAPGPSAHRSAAGSPMSRRSAPVSARATPSSATSAASTRIVVMAPR